MVERTVEDNPLRALLTALAVAVVCALVVSYSAVTLRPLYVANVEAERQARLESILTALPETMGKVDIADVRARVVELNSGVYTDDVDATTFDPAKAILDVNLSIAVPPERDLAGIKRRAHHAVVYIVHDEGGAPRALILPVYGSGYQSTLYGFLALTADTQTVLGLKFYEQNDTPGIGARIQDPDWEALWPGKMVYDDTGRLRLGVARGQVAPSSEEAEFIVDGISGATRTSLGVHELVRFWLGDYGFGPYLERVRNDRG
ncbi:MAG: NADH:ubiquinone reductase (Na(+)-transporting) subunit C [Arenicellales bacterium]|nr:NADH:ubiquinone reductase (Na(+)-transporting) subunit C [Arenicellales bacterium]